MGVKSGTGDLTTLFLCGHIGRCVVPWAEGRFGKQNWR